MHKKKTVIYIVGLSHSGSTALSFLLAQHARTVALGESHGVFIKKQKWDEGKVHRCSCSALLNQCPVWGEFLSLYGNDCVDHAKKLDLYTWKSLYSKLMRLPSLHNADIVIDSSKKAEFIPVLNKLVSDNVVDAKIIFLVRDARGWVLSDQKAVERGGHASYSYARHFYSWLTGNKHIERILVQSRVPHLLVGYEQLCFDTEEVMQRIQNFCGLTSYGQGITDNHHLAYSNRMKLGADVHRLKYDYTWMKKTALQIVYIIFPGLITHNKKWVYHKDV